MRSSFALPARSAHQRRAATAAIVAVSLVVCFGFGALAIDIERLHVIRCELQRAADAAALAAAAELSAAHSAAEVDLAARQSAQTCAARNTAERDSVSVSEVLLGGYTVESNTGKYQFTASPPGGGPTAVRVTTRKPNINLFFAPVLGIHRSTVEAQATAVLQPRDVALVVDITYTMNYDSQLFHARPHTAENGAGLPGMQINLRDIWCALNGPAPARPYVPGDETHTQYASDTGPTIGAMNTWGTHIVPNTYDPTTDAGLWYVARSATTTVSAIRTSLLSRGCSADEATQLMSGGQDGNYANQWLNRCAVITGLATWRSGRPGGRSGGDGDTLVEDGELTWIARPSYAVDWTWSDYINYVGTTYSYMYFGDSRFRYRFGLKTFTNFLLERPRYAQTNILWQTPEQPFQAIKDAVQTFAGVLVASDSSDLLSLETFDNVGRHQLNLTDDFQSVADRLYTFQAAHYELTTNIGAGINRGIAELTSNRARDNADKTIILLSDGQPNTDEDGNWSGYASSAASTYALAEAQRAADEGIRIFTITVGWDANRTLMQQIATIANGQEFYAAGTPEEYTQQLQDIFRRMGGSQSIMLIE